ncbi:phosphatidylinositol-specific phospholipase C domain-containing protein [Bacillus thuringiensis]|uniref:phosphatidylinositol-specific phospholipase C domain-containing protein n=1 Tax=Bacillus thuringiensis TaxID=1428 RepID=UPI002AB53FD6|nr:phosphatidylinositol-specific phospholipase C domain-containing protein [Bacillus thuringiensis]MDY7965684.1 phosphatidylinositol-specific phospholipase C domain-containing protein [Bacillus thuringiensis]
MRDYDNQIRDSIVPTADSNYFDRNGILTMHRSGFNVNRTVDYTNTNWMANIPDSRRISELSIPGTHGSMALHGGVAGTIGDIAINQTMNLETQLNSGIRYIDIRCRHYHNNFAIHHGRIYQHAFFGSHVLEPVISFLRRNPSETILMRIQEEYNPTGNTRTFAETFESFWTPNQRYFWNPNSNNPTLREVRGRIILLQQFPTNRGWFGINWGSLAIQDQFEVPGLNGIYNKWIAVKNHFFNAMNNRNRIHLNHLSGTGGSGEPRPWFLASGYNSRNNNSLFRIASTGPAAGWPDFPRNHPTVGPVFFGGMNVLATRRILDRRFTHTGIIAADFPGRGLIDGTIALNSPIYQPQLQGHFQIVTALNNSSVVDLNVGPNNVTLWSNNRGANQIWNFTYDQSENAHIIRSLSNPNLVLAWNVPTPDNNVFATPFVPGRSEHYWIVERFLDGYIFKNKRDTNMVLDVAGGRTTNGTNLIVYRRNNMYNQIFFVRRP